MALSPLGGPGFQAEGQGLLQRHTPLAAPVYVEQA